MANKKSNDFVRFCSADIHKLKNETNPSKKLGLMRRINLQMYAEACKSGRDPSEVCRMLDDDLTGYMELSTSVHQPKIDKLIADMKLHFVAPPMPDIDIGKMLSGLKCQESCKNKKLMENIANVFKSKDPAPIKKPANTPSVTPSVTSNPKHDSDDEIVFDLKLNRIKNLTDKPVINEPSTSSFMQPPLRVPEIKTKLPDFHKDRIKPSKFVHTYTTITSVKRKPEDDFTEVEKRPHLATDSTESNNYAPQKKFDFKTGNEELLLQNQMRHGVQNAGGAQGGNAMRKTLGGRRNVLSKFVPPVQNTNAQNTIASNSTNASNENRNNGFISNLNSNPMPGSAVDENVNARLKNIEPRMIELISNEIMNHFAPVDWNSIAGLHYAKKIIQEAVVWPILRPDIFTGIRSPPRGILLFGPPGTGKTLIGKCIASQSNSTFFSISASSLTSKWIGEGEKMVRALFAVAASHQPAVIFIDEVDSLLCQRSENEHESSRRLKTEFLVQLDGAATAEGERILIVGATNRPQELDEAARRRFVRRLYIPLPELEARKTILMDLLKKENTNMSNAEFTEVARLTDGFSGADMKVLCTEASMEPIRCIPSSQIGVFNAETVRPVMYDDFVTALNCVRASVSPDDLKQYVDWDRTYGSGSGK